VATFQQPALVSTATAELQFGVEVVVTDPDDEPT